VLMCSSQGELLQGCAQARVGYCALQIITPVVERSVTIACMTTQELVVKDFALEPDDNTLRQVGAMSNGPWALCGYVPYLLMTSAA
jgi:Domain of unknown function (DUF3819)